MKPRKLFPNTTNKMPPQRSLWEYSNAPLRDKTSNWYGFANALELGMLDLDLFAIDMGYKGFKDLDASINPAKLHQKNPSKFMKKLMASAGLSKAVNASKIKSLLKKHSSL